MGEWVLLFFFLFFRIKKTLFMTVLYQHPSNFALSSAFYRELTVARPWFDRCGTGIFPLGA